MNYDAEFFLEIEEQQMKRNLSDCFSLEQKTGEILSEKEIGSTFKHIHSSLVNRLIDYYMQRKCKGYSSSSFPELFSGELEEIENLPANLDVETLPQICEMLHVSYLNSSYAYSNGNLSKRKSKANLLEAGAVYTQEHIAYEIVQRTLNNLKTEKLSSLRILDFATGTGRFYRQIVRCLSEMGITPDSSIIDNIYAVDIDPIALNVCRINAMSLLSDLCNDKAKTVSEHILLKNALKKEQLFGDDLTISHNDLNGLFFNGFDAIVSNPPYLVLKSNKNKMDRETVETINSMAKYFRQSGIYKYSIEGMLNLYQLSLEAMLGMLKRGGEMGIICPSTIFADVSTSTLRKHLLSKHKVSYIKYFSENDPLFDNVTQATCIFHLTKGGESDLINIVRGTKTYQIAIQDVIHIFSANWEIPSIGEVEWSILRKLQSIPVLKSQPYIRNKRGELDLTLFKEYITNEQTPFRLVRGNMISGNSIADVNHEYVKPEFVKKKSQDYLTYDKGKARLICQQISNMTQKIRLRFVECEKNDILGNSCNYITVEENKIPKMKVLLNSALLNWRFKITSTNNHINNYELDELPIIDLDSISSEIVKMDEISKNREICSLYGLNSDEVDFITKQQYDII